MYYVDKQHYERFLKLIDEYNINNNDLGIDNKLGAVLYILSSSNWLIEDFKKHINKDNIDFMAMLFECGHPRELTLIRAMEDLFNDSNFIGIHHLIELSECDFNIILGAMKLRKFKHTLKDIKFVRPGGRPKKSHWGVIQDYKKQGFTQEKTAQRLALSLSTIKRNWK